MGVRDHSISFIPNLEKRSWMPAKDECPGSSGDKSGRVSQRKRIVVHLLDWHDSSFRRLLPPVTISIGRSRPVFATIAPDRDADDGANGYRGLQLTPSTNGIRAWWELLMVMNLATRLRGQSEDKRDSCQKFHKKREMTKLFRFHPIKEKRCLLKFQLQYQLWKMQDAKIVES